MNERAQTHTTEIARGAHAGIVQRALSLVNDARRSAIAKEWRRYDRMLGPAGHRALDGARLRGGERVLDVACGAGGMTLEAAHRAGARGAVVGVDVDAQAIAVATTRAREQQLRWVTFTALDVERAPLPDAAFDAIISRFGIASAADPSIALSRLGRTLVPGGRISFVCWGDSARNGWFSLPREVIAQTLGAKLGRLVAESAQGPRPFALADRTTLEIALSRAGFSAISIESFDTETWVGDDVDDALELCFETEARPLDAHLDQKQLASVTRALRTALEPHDRGDGVWLPASAWVVSATRDALTHGALAPIRR